MHAYPLLQEYPGLRALPVAGLLDGPTPVQPLADGVFVKRDDLSAADYGGNKIRKLDLLLAAARARGAAEVLTFGYAGSNFVAATAWHGRKLGLSTLAYLLPQVNAHYVADNLSVGLHAGAELHLRDSEAAIARSALLRSAVRLLRRGRLPAWIPPGGSSPLGAVGFVNAALELRAQVDAGELPVPERIYVAFSSMGTVAGLALGLELAGLPSRIMAVRVVDPHFAAPEKLRKLVRETRRLLTRHERRLAPDIERALARVQVRAEFFGEAYGVPTAATRAAIDRFTGASAARADTAYSGKALACLYHDLDAGQLRGGTALFWHTYNAHGLPPQVPRLTRDRVPEALRSYF